MIFNGFEIHMANEFIPLHCLALRLDLPKSYLKRLVKQGKIPYVATGNRKRFNQADVCNAIRQLNNAEPFISKATCKCGKDES